MDPQVNGLVQLDAQTFLKSLPVKMLTGKVKQRMQLFEELDDLLIKRTCNSKLEREYDQ